MRYDPDHQGMARLLMSRPMARPLEDVAAAALQYARSIAPVGDTGIYKNSFEAETTVMNGRETVIISNTAPYASFVEWGGRGTEGQHILARTADFIEADAVSWKRRSALPKKAAPTSPRLDRTVRLETRYTPAGSISAPRTINTSLSSSGKRFYSKRGANGRFTKA